jgi:hypothetical protein
MYFNDMYKAVNEAKEALEIADRYATKMAELLIGRLRHCYPSDLRKLKAELQKFNSTTYEWKD